MVTTIKIESKTRKQWSEIFENWSDKMDELYDIDSNSRHDATMWGDNPADWMIPYNDNVYNAWSMYDVHFDACTPGEKWEDYLQHENLLREEVAPNLTTAIDMQGAHNMPCRRCGKVDWEQDIEAVNRGYPIWSCKTENCDGILWSD